MGLAKIYPPDFDELSRVVADYLPKPTPPIAQLSDLRNDIRPQYVLKRGRDARDTASVKCSCRVLWGWYNAKL